MPQDPQSFNPDLVVSQVIDGNKDAYRLIVAEYSLLVRGFLSARIYHLDDAEDLAQETFVTAYKKALGGTKTTLRERLLERSKVSDTALIFALKNYCRFSDRPQDEEKEKVQIEITSRGKSVKTPKWLEPWKAGE